ncbi:DNA-binding transcriptional regulator, LysR family [Franzmannia pantelleriensis]|uniref:DNA-binding transcriptional regulator, LysR family n=1 Tax=Franzmannia pantelleriensis TaxID=48727 RepID=A0A1G9GB45_9GAMM|nr:LysR family transcriptional regulator [Halomonas pantelleriensis]SDK97909.1 DNA-binding transcriptional regulator, LysR family [Halomonas pantelleriensis]
MDFRQLRTLIAIAEEGSFSRAAEAVHLTPSAVSQQMAALESELDIAIFDRSARPTTLNARGLILLSAAKEMVLISNKALTTISGRELAGTLSLGTVRSSIFRLLPRAIATLTRSFPELSIRLRTGKSEELLRDVAAGKLDAAIVAEHASMPAKIRWHPFISEPLLVIAPPSTAATDAISALKTHPFIRFQSNVPLAHLIEDELSKLSLDLNSLIEVDTIPALIACVESGLGVSITPHTALRDSPHMELPNFPFGDPVVHRKIGLAEQLSSPRSDIVACLHDELAKLSAPFGIYTPKN